MATRARLDVTRSRLVEEHISKHVYAREIVVPNGGKSLVHQWRHTNTYTLNPLNFTTDFRESNAWERLKFRLADVNYNVDWWEEIPNNTRADVGPCDYFFNSIVKNVNVPSGYPSSSHFLLLELLTNVGAIAAVNTLNFQQSHGVAMLQCKYALPANQGYELRFRVDGRETTTRGRFMDFYFGEYMLGLNTNGEAELWQSPDFTNYALVYVWQFAESSQVHGRSHSIYIFPHRRNAIEFYSTTGARQVAGHLYFRQRGTNGGGLYEIPGEYQFDTDGNFVITQPAPWTVVHTREFRALLQVSRLGFANGTQYGGSASAGLYDSPFDIGFPPLQPFDVQVEADTNGCGVFWNLFDADSGTARTPWASDGTRQRIQFGVGFTGLGDIPGPGLGSSRTPELYGYTIDKPERFETVERDEIEMPILRANLSFGDTAEAERLTLELANDDGQCEDFEERADVPLQLYDDETGVVFFEGTSFEVETTECPAEDAGHVRLEVNGMVDNGLRTLWTVFAPDFGKDPHDPQQRGYQIATAIRRVFMAEGVPPEQLVIEEEKDYLSDFRLWNNPLAGGSRQGSGASAINGSLLYGDGATAQETPLRRWKPREGTAVNEFAEFLIRDTLGWHYVWDRRDGCWHVYKRPDPNNALDVARNKFEPLVEFYDDSVERLGTIPAYRHSHLRKRAPRPICTTVILATIKNMADIPDRATLNKILADAAANNLNPNDPILQTTPRLVMAAFDNKHGYPNPWNDPPDIQHPDWLGEKRLRLIPAVEACTDDAIEWIGRRFYEDYTQAHRYRTFVSDWGDAHTAYLRKWDIVLVNGTKWYIDTIEPHIENDLNKRATYHVVKYREDARPPR